MTSDGVVRRSDREVIEPKSRKEMKRREGEETGHRKKACVCEGEEVAISQAVDISATVEKFTTL